jgi:hypothetical protein
MYCGSQTERSKKESVAHLNESDSKVTAYFCCKHSLTTGPLIILKYKRTYARDGPLPGIPNLKSDLSLGQYWRRCNLKGERKKRKLKNLNRISYTTSFPNRASGPNVCREVNIYKLYLRVKSLLLL